MMTACAECPRNMFDDARNELEKLLRRLTSTGAMSHVDLGAVITEGVQRIGANAYQGYLDGLFEDERAHVAQWRRPTGTEIRVHERQLETEFGRMTVRRHGHKLPREMKRFPMDELLNLPPTLYALPLREATALDAVDVSFERVVNRIDRTTSGHVPKRQAEEETNRAAADFEAFYAQRTALASNDTLSDRALVVMSVDGKGINMRKEALRDATRKEADARAENKGRGDPMACKPLRKAGKRMAVVTAIWEQEPYVRTPNDVLDRLGRDARGRARSPRPERAPRLQNKRIAASVTASAAHAIASMFDEAERRDPEHQRRIAMIVDGAEHQIQVITDEATKRAMTITIVLDLIHVIHYLWKIAMILCAGEKCGAERWIAATLSILMTKTPHDVIARIRKEGGNCVLSRADSDALDAATGYLRKNAARIHYAEFLRDGLPIASGVIEGACRHLVEDRLGITGARWGLIGADAVLKLRAIRSNGDWDAYWRFHLDAERRRNHPRGIGYVA